MHSISGQHTHPTASLLACRYNQQVCCLLPQSMTAPLYEIDLSLFDI